MTKKIAISLPDDVADRVAREENASAFITDAIRVRMSSEKTQAILRGLGFELSAEDMAQAASESAAARAAATPELRAKAAALRAAGMGGAIR
jgi:CO dehydrogenase/acetyl-CoA synthase beta subunit